MIKGIYIHVPFCLNKCYYCDFLSGIDPKSEYAKEYFEAIEKELQMYMQIYDLSFVETIYFGGGTPSLFPKEIGKIVDIISMFSSIIKEITVEANPAYDFDPHKFSFATRISFGIQTFYEKYLRFLGRIHTPLEAKLSLERASKYFSVNGDLIFGIPEQKPEEHLEDIKTVINMGVNHISCYLLEIHENTPLSKIISKEKLKVPEDAHDFFQVQRYATEKGFLRYEVSNFAKPNNECQHNMLYWNREDFLGIGASAWSKIGNRRFCNMKNLKKYYEKINNRDLPIEFSEDITGFKAIEEIIFLGLRKIRDGLDLGELEYFNISISEFLKMVQDYRDFLIIDERRIRIKEEHIPIIDGLTVRLIIIAEKLYGANRLSKSSGFNLFSTKASFL